MDASDATPQPWVCRLNQHWQAWTIMIVRSKCGWAANISQHDITNVQNSSTYVWVILFLVPLNNMEMIHQYEIVWGRLQIQHDTFRFFTIKSTNLDCRWLQTGWLDVDQQEKKDVKLLTKHWKLVETSFREKRKKYNRVGPSFGELTSITVATHMCWFNNFLTCNNRTCLNQANPIKTKTKHFALVPHACWQLAQAHCSRNDPWSPAGGWPSLAALKIPSWSKRYPPLGDKLNLDHDSMMKNVRENLKLPWRVGGQWINLLTIKAGKSNHCGSILLFTVLEA